MTAIEDELQDYVNETLKDFSDAGIKLWVLTGDKKDIAKSISYSCGLFDDENFNIFDISEGLNKIQLEARLNELVEQFNNLVDKMDVDRPKNIKFLSFSKIGLGHNSNLYNYNDSVININANLKIKKANFNNLVSNQKEYSEKTENINISENNIKNNRKSQNNNNNNYNYNEALNEKSDNIIKPRFALVISIDELNILSLNYELEILFYELSSRCNSVLC